MPSRSRQFAINPTSEQAYGRSTCEFRARAREGQRPLAYLVAGRFPTQDRDLPDRSIVEFDGEAL